MDASIQTQLERLQPRSVLECSLAPWDGLPQYCSAADIPMQSYTPSDVLTVTDPVDLAIVHQALEHTDPTLAKQLLGYLRNGLARRIWLLLEPNDTWHFSDLIALGFKRDAASLAAHESYIYDLHSYNHQRSWNNARFWANPQNFNKFRW